MTCTNTGTQPQMPCTCTHAHAKHTHVQDSHCTHVRVRAHLFAYMLTCVQMCTCLCLLCTCMRTHVQVQYTHRYRYNPDCNIHTCGHKPPSGEPKYVCAHMHAHTCMSPHCPHAPPTPFPPCPHTRSPHETCCLSCPNTLSTHCPPGMPYGGLAAPLDPTSAPTLSTGPAGMGPAGSKAHGALEPGGRGFMRPPRPQPRTCCRELPLGVAVGPERLTRQRGREPGPASGRECHLSGDRAAPPPPRPPPSARAAAGTLEGSAYLRMTYMTRQLPSSPPTHTAK